MSDADLRQADLSHLSLSEMTPEQRAEMRRRYDDFVQRLAKPPKAPERRIKAPSRAKWVPGMKAARR